MCRLRSTCRLWFLIIACFILTSVHLALGSPPLTGKLLYMQGQVAIRSAGTEALIPAQLNQDLYAGDAVITGPVSRAAILCIDESQVKLNENTILILKQVLHSTRLETADIFPVAARGSSKSSYEIPQGEVWFRNKYENSSFDLETPAVTAGIRGTELNIRVQKDGATSVILLEGSVFLFNDYGSVSLNPGEEGLAQPGKAPTKHVLLQPSDAVQWSLYYPGLFSYRDLPMRDMRAGHSFSNPLEQGIAAYDQGNLEQAQSLTEAILAEEPTNSRALTLAGWISLQKNKPNEARIHFERVKEADSLTIIGHALALYRMDDIIGAYVLITSGYERLPRTSMLSGMSGFFALMAGRVDEARERLETATRQDSESALPQALLAQIHLVQNRKEAALNEASAALARYPNSPLVQLSMGLVKIAYFDLTAARLHFSKAIELDPKFVNAYVYLAKTWLGSEFLDRAQRTIEKAIAIAPEDGAVLSLAGFVRLAFRDFERAKTFFDKAIKYSPGLGEPHLGSAIYYFRHRNSSHGLGEMLAATLLEPRVALYQTELGKALYQVKAFDKALSAYEYAKGLDPKDPTPFLYKGIALTDLNRPGEAIQEFNRSIELNDNRALFRSRIMLDRDLALRNYNLARAYNQLGLQEWGFSKAVTSVKNDPLNSSAHLFLLNSYGTSSFSGQAGQRVAAENQEALLFRTLSPANQSTFTNIQMRSANFATPNLGLSFDYTPMFEMPYARAAVRAGGGAWEEKESIQEYTGLLYGGTPGAAYYLFGNYTNDRGFRSVNDAEEAFNVEMATKWEPTVKGTFTGFFQYAESQAGDKSNRNLFSYEPSESQKASVGFKNVEISYVHRFSPESIVLAYYTHRPVDLLQSLFDPVFIQGFFGRMRQKLNFYQEFDNFQLQQQLIVGNHTFMAGFDYFSSRFDFNFKLDFLFPDFSIRVNQANDTLEHSYSFYLLDYWRLTSNLLIEMGMFADFSSNPRAGFPDPIKTDLWSPFLGVNYQINSQHTLRMAVQRHLNTHFQLQQLLVPSEVAGFPWVIDSDHGAELLQAGGAWEAQWNPRTFSTVRFDAVKISSPDLDRNDLGEPFFVEHSWKRYQGTVSINRILTPSTGLTLGLVCKQVLPDDSFADEIKDYFEIDPFVRFAYLHKSGWLGRISAFLVHQDLKDRPDNLFPQVDVLIGKELGNKRGLFSFEVENVFNERFDYALEPLRTVEFFPSRRFLFKLALYF
ncbi:MAG: tetratricopeptide repeat protein [Syntrophobacteraceae bacterium]